MENSISTSMTDLASPIRTSNLDDSYASHLQPNDGASELQSEKRIIENEKNINDEPNIATMEPYAAYSKTDGNSSQNKNWNMVNRRKKRTTRQLRKMTTMQELFAHDEPYYEKYFVVIFPDTNLSNEISIIKLDKEIKEKIGQTMKTLRSGRNALLIEARNKSQSDKLKKLEKLVGKNVRVECHKKFNLVKGVIRTAALRHDTEEEIREHLASSGVVDVQRMKIKRNNELIETDTYFLTFNLHTLPKVLTITGWHLVKVEEFKYKPQQCFKCHLYGHVLKYCRREETRCARCGTMGHRSSECTAEEPSCYHCSGNHFSTDKDCPKYKCEELIIETEMNEKIPKREAMELTLERNPQYANLYEKPETDENRQEIERETNMSNKETQIVNRHQTFAEVVQPKFSENNISNKTVHSNTNKPKTNENKQNLPQNQQKPAHYSNSINQSSSKVSEHTDKEKRPANTSQSSAQSHTGTKPKNYGNKQPKHQSHDDMEIQTEQELSYPDKRNNKRKDSQLNESNENLSKRSNRDNTNRDQRSNMNRTNRERNVASSTYDRIPVIGVQGKYNYYPENKQHDKSKNINPRSNAT